MSSLPSTPPERWLERVRAHGFPRWVIRHAVRMVDALDGFHHLGPLGEGDFEDPQEYMDEAVKAGDALQGMGFLEYIDEDPGFRLVLPETGASGGESVKQERTTLYHYYDAHGVLLYIGVTKAIFRRQASHESQSTWAEFVARSTIEHFPSRAEAEAAERAAIQAKHPLFNVEHNSHPDRVPRLVDYLIARDRRDLLIPKVSRG